MVFEQRARQLMLFSTLAMLKIRPFAAITVANPKKIILTYFQNLESFKTA